MGKMQSTIRDQFMNLLSNPVFIGKLHYGKIVFFDSCLSIYEMVLMPGERGIKNNTKRWGNQGKARWPAMGCEDTKGKLGTYETPVIQFRG
jgi:hypothetical protein